MGHMINYKTCDEKCNRKKILKEITDLAYKDGDGYSGPIHWHDEMQPLENYEEAQKWISAHDRGWYDDHAVRYYEYSHPKETKATEDLKRRIKETFDKKEAYAKSHSVLNFKADFIGCQNCSSKVARKFLKSDYCPVCHADLRSKTTLDTISGYEAKRKELSKRLQKESEKNSTRSVKWLVKFEYHC